MTHEAIILAGGLGTRLREAVPDLPKCMAPVNGKPFIDYVLKHLQHQGIRHFIFSLGYKSEAFTGYLEQTLSRDKYSIVIEKEPLGTGGAIRFACSASREEQVLVVNGDSLFAIDLSVQSDFHQSHQADCTLALKPMENFDRYGAVVLEEDQSIRSFQEKKFYARGLINGGVYLLNKASFLNEDMPEKFSFETDYLQKLYPVRRFYGVIQEGYFIDIGIPGDYQKAQIDLQ
ncbi:MAG: nucleotidyltransferase family protein [Bacteroidota bacterium]|nr:nucleotidyltransferase family protein [Bacteroidota bacterium]